MECEVKEKSFVLTNFPKGKTEPKGDAKELRKLGLKWCKKYEQEYFFYKPTVEVDNAYYINQNNKIEKKFIDISPTQAVDIYFTNLKKTKIGKSFTYRENTIYLAESPKSTIEAYMRYGEMFFSV